jgi:hypothetical protein
MPHLVEQMVQSDRMAREDPEKDALSRTMHIHVAGARRDVAQLVLPGAIRMRLRPFVDRRVSLVQVTATLDITLVSAMRGCNAARATRRHTEQR